MELYTPLAGFFAAIKKDCRISVTHIGIYAAVLQYWQQQGCPVPLQVYSYELMEVAKISSKTTYHQYIRDLHDYGYIKYEPSFKRNARSKVYVLY
jgi:hypothetical protein